MAFIIASNNKHCLSTAIDHGSSWVVGCIGWVKRNILTENIQKPQFAHCSQVESIHVNSTSKRLEYQNQLKSAARFDPLHPPSKNGSGGGTRALAHL